MDFNNPALKDTVLIFCKGSMGEKIVYVIPPARTDWNPLTARYLLEDDGQHVIFVSADIAKHIRATGVIQLDDIASCYEVVGVRVSYDTISMRRQSFQLPIDGEWDGSKTQKRPHLERGGFYKGRRGSNSNFRGR